MTDKSGFIQKRLGFMFSLCDASSKMIPSSVRSRKRLFCRTNKHESMLPPRPGVQIPCEKLANFAKLLLLVAISAEAPRVPRQATGCAGRLGHQWNRRPSGQAAVTREGEELRERG